MPIHKSLLLTLQVTTTRCFEITSHNYVDTPSHHHIYYYYKRITLQKNWWGCMILNVFQIMFHDPKCVSHDLALSNSILHSFQSIQESFKIVITSLYDLSLDPLKARLFTARPFTNENNLCKACLQCSFFFIVSSCKYLSIV